MTKFKESFLLLFLVFINFTFADVFFNVVNREDPCVNLCEKITTLTITKDTTKYMKSCCQRGCRFFNLVDLSQGFINEGFNGTAIMACEASCSEAYTVTQDRDACKAGCNYMSKQRISDLLSLLSVAVYVEENVGIDTNALLMSPEIPETDILTDPSLRKELLPGWWDSDGFKLPQTFVKTVPMDSGTADYGIPSDYSGENDQSVSLPGSDWLQCASRHTGIPRWLLGSAIVGAALSILWLCLFPKEQSDFDIGIKETETEKQNLPSKMMVYIPDEAPLYQSPPPKYSDLKV